MESRSMGWIVGGTAAAVVVVAVAAFVASDRGATALEPAASAIQAASDNDVQITNQVNLPPPKVEEAPPKPEPVPLPNQATLSELLARLEPFEKDRNTKLAIASDMEKFAQSLGQCGQEKLSKTFSDSMERMRTASVLLDEGIATAKQFAQREDPRSFSDALDAVKRVADKWELEWKDELSAIISAYRLRIAMADDVLDSSTRGKDALRRRAQMINYYLTDISNVEIDATLRQFLFVELEKHMNLAYEGRVRQANCRSYGYCLGVLNRLKLTAVPAYWDENVRASMKRFDELRAELSKLDHAAPFNIDAMTKLIFEYQDYADIDDAFKDVWLAKVERVRQLKKDCSDNMQVPPFAGAICELVRGWLNELILLVSDQDEDVQSWLAVIAEVEKVQPKLREILGSYLIATSKQDYKEVADRLKSFLTMGIHRTAVDKLVATTYYADAIAQLAVGTGQAEQRARYKSQLEMLNEILHVTDWESDVRIDGLSTLAWAKYQQFYVSCWHYEHYRFNAQLKQYSREGGQRAWRVYQELMSSKRANERDRDGLLFVDKMKERLDSLKIAP